MSFFLTVHSISVFLHEQFRNFMKKHGQNGLIRSNVHFISVQFHFTRFGKFLQWGASRFLKNFHLKKRKKVHWVTSTDPAAEDR